MVSYTLSDIVREYIIETLGDEQLNRFKRYFYLGTSFLRENHYDMSGDVLSVELPFNIELDTVDLPNNYLNYVKIGICAGGVVYALGRNESICLDRNYNVCGVPVRECPVEFQNQIFNGQVGYFETTPEYYADHYRNGEITGRFFGIGGGNNQNGYYKVDKERNQLRLMGVNCHVNSIMLEYITDLTSVGDDFIVHPFLIETLKSYMFWKSIQRDRNRSLGEKQLAESDYWKAFKTSRKRLDVSTLEDWRMAIRSGNFASPHF